MKNHGDTMIPINSSILTLLFSFYSPILDSPLSLNLINSYLKMDHPVLYCILIKN